MKQNSDTTERGHWWNLWRINCCHFVFQKHIMSYIISTIQYSWQCLKPICYLNIHHIHVCGFLFLSRNITMRLIEPRNQVNGNIEIVTLYIQVKRMCLKAWHMVTWPVPAILWGSHQVHDEWTERGSGADEGRDGRRNHWGVAGVTGPSIRGGSKGECPRQVV